jgi:hypothetical protein
MYEIPVAFNEKFPDTNPKHPIKTDSTKVGVISF